MKTRFLAAFFAIAGTGIGSAATITFQQGVSPTGSYAHLGQDIRGNGNVNTGADMLVGYQSGGVLQVRSLLAYSLSAIPAGAVIDSITLTLTVNNTGNGTVGGLGTINLHEIIPNGNGANNLTEGQITWTNWNNTTPTAWTTPGGDYGSILSNAVVSGAPTDSFTNGQTATFASSSAFVAAAQAAFNAGQPLELILISPTAEGTTGASNFARFGSDDAITPANRPLLTINYTIPEPSAAALAGLAVLGACAVRRRIF